MNINYDGMSKTYKGKPLQKARVLRHRAHTNMEDF